EPPNLSSTNILNPISPFLDLATIKTRTPYSFEIRDLLLTKYCPVQTKLGHGCWKYRNIWKCC
ncbi:MAG: hypothetical protein V3T52_00585, partial [Thermodesulfobacteriota bacterium]